MYVLQFKRLSAVKTGTTADVIGIIQDVDTLKRVGGGTYAKRTITLVDGKNGRLTVRKGDTYADAARGCASAVAL